MDIKNVSFAYRDNIKRLKQIDAHINKGEITTIIGPNGSGKSTLMGVLMNHNKPQEGEVLLQDQSLHTYKAKALAKTLGVVHQHNVAPQDMTVETLIYYGRLPYKRPFSPYTSEDEEIVEWALECTGLHDKRHEFVETLSGGQQQRAWIAMAIAQKTPYLLLDEPTSNLDIFYQYDILKLIKHLRDEQELTIVMVLHDINQAIQYSDTIIAMKAGEIIKIGHPKHIMTKELIYDVYGVNVAVKKDDDLGMYIVPIGV